MNATGALIYLLLGSGVEQPWGLSSEEKAQKSKTDNSSSNGHVQSKQDNYDEANLVAGDI